MALDSPQTDLAEVLRLQQLQALNVPNAQSSAAVLGYLLQSQKAKKEREYAEQQRRAAFNPNQVTSWGSATPDETAKQIAAQQALYKSYLNKALDYNNVSLNDLNADAGAISGGIINYLNGARGWLQGQLDNDFAAAFKEGMVDALRSAYAYTRNVGPNGQYQTGASSGSTTSWDSLLNSSREEQLKAFFDKYGGIQGFTSDPEDTATVELNTIRHDYEAFTDRLLPQIRRAFNISNADQARKIAGYMATQLLHQGTEQNTAFPWFQDPYDYHHEAAEDALEKLEEALKNPDVLAVMDKMVRTDTALNEFEAANKAYNDLVTARNAREAQLQTRYGDTRNAGQRLVSMLTDQALDAAIRAKKGTIDSVNTLYNL